jgi:hypothetical protein
MTDPNSCRCDVEPTRELSGKDCHDLPMNGPRALAWRPHIPLAPGHPLVCFAGKEIPEIFNRGTCFMETLPVYQEEPPKLPIEHTDPFLDPPPYQKGPQELPI